MKLEKLILEAFGPFTGKVLDFSSEATGAEAGTPAIHLIYGPNEAGKSSALRAMLDLRFGIPMRSNDDFIHAHKDMRISGVFTTQDGERIALSRRKGNKNTLTALDPDSLEALSDQSDIQALETALRGGMGREDFERMFGLDHERLRAGGEHLLSGEGELGAALFEASAGLSGQDMAAILKGLDDDARAIFMPGTRAKKGEINSARAEYNEQGKAWKQAIVRPRQWQELSQAHEAAQSSLAQWEQRLEDQRRLEQELVLLRTVAPTLQGIDAARARLEELKHAPDLPHDAREQRLAAEQALANARQSMAEEQERIAQCKAELGSLIIEEKLLSHAAGIERMVNEVEGLPQRRQALIQANSQVQSITEELAQAAKGIAPDMELEALLSARPSRAERQQLDEWLDDVTAQADRLSLLRDQSRQLSEQDAHEGDEAAKDGRDIPRLEQIDQALDQALQQARQLGNADQRLSELEQDINRLKRELKLDFAELGDLASIEAAKPILDSQLREAEEQRRQGQEARREAQRRCEELAEQISREQQNQASINAAGRLATQQTLDQARDRRDRGWQWLRQCIIDAEPAEQRRLEPAYDPNQELPEAFEQAMRQADQQSDSLRQHADEVARLEQIEARLTTLQSAREQADQALKEHDQALQRHQSDWAAELAVRDLPELSPEALREWQAQRRQMLELHERIQAGETEQLQLSTDLAASADALIKALAAAGQQPRSQQWRALREQATEAQQSITQARADQRAEDKARRQRQADRQRLNSEIRATEGSLGELTDRLSVWKRRLFLSDDASAKTLRARLRELDALAEQAAELRAAQAKREEQQAALDDFKARLLELHQLLGELPEAETLTALEDSLRQLAERSERSREQANRRDRLNNDKNSAQQRLERATRQSTEQSERLETLRLAADAQSIDELPQRETEAQAKQAEKQKLNELLAQLQAATSLDEPTLRERYQGRDIPRLETEESRAEAEREEIEASLKNARQAEEEARHRLNAIDDSDQAAQAREAMESAAARMRGRVEPWARLRLAQALLRRAIHQYQERSRAPMIEAASRYFSALTGGSFSRLITEDMADFPVILGERKAAKGEKARALKISEMSEGTRDQLYLSLRLAALELRGPAQQGMPLVLDDVLITSDDQRVANTLKALSQFANRNQTGNQVLLFTHHWHLIELAADTLGDALKTLEL